MTFRDYLEIVGVVALAVFVLTFMVAVILAAFVVSCMAFAAIFKGHDPVAYLALAILFLL